VLSVLLCLTMDERRALIALTLVPALVPHVVKRLLEACGSAVEIWRAADTRLRAIPGMSPAALTALLAARPHIAVLVEETLTYARQQAIAIITLQDAAYPSRLKTIHDPPPALYVRGTLVPEDDLALAIVGAREATPYGVEVAERFAADLAAAGVTVVSGLARGIDTAAHRGALRVGGRTIAVVGSGLAHRYPRDHARCAEEIAQAGAVISEFPLSAPPRPAHFPQRNRLISGLSLGVLIVEAGARSGALITASCAAEQGREVFAVPGKITSALSEGTHALLKDGARLVTGVGDICEELHLSFAPVRGVTLPTRAALAADAQRVLALLSDEPLHVDAIAAASGFAPGALASLVLQLELQSLVRQWPGQRYTKSQGSDP